MTKENNTEPVKGKLAQLSEKISPRDRNMMVMLGIFLLSMAYYIAVLEPVYSKWEKAGSVLAKKEKELKKRKRKIREKKNWLEDKEKLAVQIAEIMARIKMPDSDSKIPERVKAIMQASRKSSLKVNDIRPMSTLLDDGETQVVNTFSIEGFTMTMGFIDFIENIWGMKIEELSLSMSQQAAKPIKYYTKLVSLDKKDPILKEIASGEKVSPGNFRLMNDPFFPKIRKVEVQEKEPPEELEMEVSLPDDSEEIGMPGGGATSGSIAGLRLVGIADFGNRPTAILWDDSKGEDYFLSMNEKILDFTVTEIYAKGVALTDGGGTVNRLEFPEVSDSLETVPFEEVGHEAFVPANEAEAQPVNKKGRLGFQIKTLTPAMAREKGLPLAGGLLVTKGREGETDVTKGDIITSINGIKVAAISQAAKIMKTVNAGDEVMLELYKNGEHLEVNIRTME